MYNSNNKKSYQFESEGCMKEVGSEKIKFQANGWILPKPY